MHSGILYGKTTLCDVAELLNISKEKKKKRNIDAHIFIYPEHVKLQPEHVKLQPMSCILNYHLFVLQYPPCYKDISFWINESFTENNFCEVVRAVAGDLVEEVCVFLFFLYKFEIEI